MVVTVPLGRRALLVLSGVKFRHVSAAGRQRLAWSYGSVWTTTSAM
jgi:hypothetical protein